MSTSAFFSVLVPVYNVAPYLRECLDSILGQDFSDFELLLVDDGSTDDSGAICDEYAANDPRIRVFHKPNGGQLSARRYGIERAEGAYYVFVDSDDWLSAGMFSRLSAAIRETGADCLIFGAVWDKPGAPEHVVCPPEICGRVMTDRREVLGILLNDDGYNSLCRKCAGRSCFDGRDFTPWFHIRHGEDRLQSTEILENARSFLFLPDELYHYRVNADSITHSICYDDYRVSFELDRCIDAWLERLQVFTAPDWRRYHGHQQDKVVLDVKRICRWCSGRDKAVAALQALAEDPYYRENLCLPYAGKARGLRALLNRIVLCLLSGRRLGILYRFCTHFYRGR